MTSMEPRVLVGVFTDRSAADGAYDELRRRGFDEHAVGFVTRAPHETRAGETLPPHDPRAGALNPSSDVAHRPAGEPAVQEVDVDTPRGAAQGTQPIEAGGATGAAGGTIAGSVVGGRASARRPGC